MFFLSLTQSTLDYEAPQLINNILYDNRCAPDLEQLQTNAQVTRHIRWEKRLWPGWPTFWGTSVLHTEYQIIRRSKCCFLIFFLILMWFGVCCWQKHTIVSGEFSLQYLILEIIALQLHSVCNHAAVSITFAFVNIMQKSAFRSDNYAVYMVCMQTKPQWKCSSRGASSVWESCGLILDISSVTTVMTSVSHWTWSWRAEDCS